MTKQIQFASTLALADGVPIPLSTCSGAWSSLDLEITNIVKALGLVHFRGMVIFVITGDNIPYWTSVVTFTDDIPAGIWNTTNHHPK